jgi:hypothetical protein
MSNSFCGHTLHHSLLQISMACRHFFVNGQKYGGEMRRLTFGVSTEEMHFNICGGFSAFLVSPICTCFWFLLGSLVQFLQADMSLTRSL